jgi:hypothetical protein
MADWDVGEEIACRLVALRSDRRGDFRFATSSFSFLFLLFFSPDFAQIIF